MKRIAAALLILSLAAPVQAAITVYGLVDLGVLADRDSGKASTRVDSGNQTASHLGFKGSEELGAGWSASMLVESQIEADTGQPSFSGRPFGSQSWVGLSGPLGSVKLGRMFTPYFGAIASNDPFDAKGPGESTRLFQDSGVRMDNTIKYSLPQNLHGFYGDLAYGVGEVPGNAAALRQISMDAGYATARFNLQLAYHSSNDAGGALLVRSTLVAGHVELGPMRVWLVLARNRNHLALDTRDSLIGISMPIGRATLAADWVRKQDRFLANADATQLAMGCYYTLSPRTNVYLVASHVDNDSAARYQATLPGGSRRQLASGIRHKF